MTPTTLEAYIRQRHNSVGDTFWSSQEILDLVWAACLEMAREALVIENVYTTTTVAGTQAYSYPTNTIAIKRITYDGAKLQMIDMREDDQITGQYQTSTSQGNSQYYYVWNDTIYLRPVPSSAVTLKIFSFNEPQQLTTTSSLEIPSQFHIDTVDYVLSCMHGKEKNFEGAQYYKGLWDARLIKIKQWQRKRLRADGFASVKDMDSISSSFLGVV